MKVGNFSSSEIYKLCNYGERLMNEQEAKEWVKENPKSKAKYTKDEALFSEIGNTYIKIKNFENNLKRPINVRKDTRATLWGNFLEQFVYNKLPNTYDLIGQGMDESIFHQTVPYWCGKPDLVNKSLNKVSDIKCPEPLAFCNLVEHLSKGYDFFKNEHPDYFWQLISNSILTGLSNIELIVFMPYESEIEEIRIMAMDYDGADMYKYRFIYEAPLIELPYLPDNSKYKDMNCFEFEAREEDVNYLSNRVKYAINYLDK